MADLFCYVDNVRYSVITLAEALDKAGFPIENLAHPDCYNREWAKTKLVADRPRKANLHPGGKPWVFCGGVGLFGFGFVSEGDERGYCREQVSGVYIVAASKVRQGFADLTFELVFPG